MYCNGMDITVQEKKKICIILHYSSNWKNIRLHRLDCQALSSRKYPKNIPQEAGKLH